MFYYYFIPINNASIYMYIFSKVPLYIKKKYIYEINQSLWIFFTKAKIQLALASNYDGNF